MLRALLLSLAVATPHPTLKVYAQATLTDVAWQQGVFQRVAKGWVPAPQKPAPGRKAVVQVVLAHDGKLLSATVDPSSGSKPWDDAALKAVQKAAPFAALPKAFEAPTLEVHFHFAWEG